MTVSPPGAVRVPFTHRRGAHCGSSSLRDLLEHHRLAWDPQPLSEATVFGLSGAYSLLYAEYPVLPDAPGVTLPLYLLGRSTELEAGACATLGIDVELRRTDDAAEGWRWVRDELDAGRPALVWANTRDLDYLDVKLDNTRHDLVVVGYDEAEGVAYVADHDRDGIERCSLASLARARSSGAFPGPNRHATWILRFPERLPEPRTAVRAALRATVETMHGERPVDVPAEQGLAAIDALAAAYPGWPERHGDGLRWMLKLLRVLVARAGTGGTLFRSLQAGFLHESADLLGDAGLEDAARVQDELSDAWAALVTAVRGPDVAAAHERGLAAVERVAHLERVALEAMETWLSEEDG